MNSSSSTTSAIPSGGVAQRALPAVGALFFGLMLFLVAGFAAPTVLHNATHDTRHALGLPCH